MKKPTEKELKKVFDSERARLASINMASFNSIDEVRLYVKKRLKKLLKSPSRKRTRSLEAFITAKYMKMFENIENELIASYNASIVEQAWLAEKALKTTLDLGLKPISTFPKTKAFSITNKVLNEKAVAIRSKKMAKRVSAIIANAVEKGYGVDKTSRLLDTEFGFRDKRGKINDLTLKQLKSGRITRTNGHFAQTYRIARTESMRMSSIAGYQTFDELSLTNDKTRMRLLAHVDTRTRAQSLSMNNQISDKDGKFLYPDGSRYRLGSPDMPPQWSINDRETSYVVFI